MNYSLTRYPARWLLAEPIAIAVTLAAVFGIVGCGPRSATPSSTKAASQSTKDAHSAGHNGSNDVDSDDQKPKSDMLVADYFGLAPGNCILVTTTSGKHILIDAGPPGTEQDVLTRLQQSEVTTLDYVIITCPTAEHIGCLPVLLGGMTYGQVLTPGLSAPLMSQVEQVVHAGGGKLRTLRAGTVVPLDDDTTLEALAPDKNSTAPAHPTQDWYENHSLVFRIKYNKASLLFTGDMGPDERSWLYSSGTNLRSSILSGLHHGDRRLGDLQFVHTVSPVMAVLMCQIGNKSGFPHSETLDAMKTTMTTVFRTDIQSDVVVRVRSNGQLGASPARTGTDHEMSLAGSEIKAGLKSSGSVQLENPPDESDSFGSQQPGGLQ